MSKHALKVLVSSSRGAHALPLVVAAVERMSEEEARQWLVFLRNLQADTTSLRINPYRV